jgi:plastocyanin
VGATVSVRDDVFEPTEVTVAKGEAVAWRWSGNNPHNVSGPGFKSKIQTSGTFTRTFAKAGSFDYRCEVHPGMTGAVVVTG